ncbi:GNAT family protein [Exiguobacterium algae]|uniref:GNAT family N-acetyltransferase n=1 Tax=Exiguobacterium algae TaxID=2751250 RepID=UPI0030B86717
MSLVPLHHASDAITQTFNRWNNDPKIVHLIRPSRSEEELKAIHELSTEDLEKRLDTHDIFLIYADDQLVGEVNTMYNPSHLYHKEPGSAWLGLVIGEAIGRGKGVGTEALRLLEAHLRRKGTPRIELGVFEFNEAAYRLYQKMGYHEIGRVEDFTYWRGKLWADIRMEKRLD